MERITTYKGKWWIPVLIAFGILLAVLTSLIIPPASADVFVYGTNYNYSEVILPNNSYVHQGENISQGNYYDLTGVYGWSGELVHWNNDNLVGQGLPDQIVTLAGRGMTYADPAKFPVGRWWQWDNKYCTAGSDICVTGFGHGNPYAFYVAPQLVSQQKRTIVRTSNITVSQNGSSIQIPVTYTEVQTYYGTPVPTVSLGASGTIMVPTPIPTETAYSSNQQPNTDVQDQNGILIVGGVAGAVPVTAKSPVPVVVPVFAIIGLLFVVRGKH
jgi:hypothetical protein